ncbi:MAG TPA: hypothetical protein VGK33_07480, partial [Chloroflexota bacterium]
SAGGYARDRADAHRGGYPPADRGNTSGGVGGRQSGDGHADPSRRRPARGDLRARGDERARHVRGDADRCGYNRASLSGRDADRRDAACADAGRPDAHASPLTVRFWFER